MSIRGYTDFGDEHSDAIGRSAFASMTSLIIAACLCALILTIHGNGWEVYVMALFVLVQVVVCNYYPLSKAYDMGSIPAELRESTASRARRYILFSTILSIILLLSLTRMFVRRCPARYVMHVPGNGASICGPTVPSGDDQWMNGQECSPDRSIGSMGSNSPSSPASPWAHPAPPRQARSTFS